MVDRICAYDWSRTPLGPIAQWPDALVVLVNAVVASQVQMLLFWGNDLIQLYNDAFVPVLGPDKHPSALGKPAADCWAEIWATTGPRIYAAQQGQACFNEDQYTPIYRYGAIDDAWFTYSYSPVRDSDGSIGGVLVTCVETTGRMKAVQALLGERTRLLELFRQSPAFFAVLRGPEHIFEMANPPYLRLIHGRDVIGKSLPEAIPEAAEQGFVQILDKVYRTGEPFVGQNVLFTSSGGDSHAPEDRYLDFVYQPLREADGAVSGIIVLGVDITDRKRANEALRRSETSAQNILESITDGFHVIDAEGRFQQFNAAGREIYKSQGVDADALIGVHVLTAFPGLEETEIGKTIFATLEEREATVIESCYPPWNRWFAVRNFPTPTGGVATFFQDITERKRTERLLREQRERFDFATHASQIGYWFCDLPFDKLIWDARVKEHFWLAPDAEVDIERFYQILHPDDRERTRNAIDEAIANHTRYDTEYRTVSSDGRQKWIRAIGRTAYDAGGRPLRFDGVTQDVTELKATQEALDDERRRLSAVFENVPIGLVFTEAGGRVRSGNAQAERILGHRIPAGKDGENYRDWVAFHADGRLLEAADHPLALALGDGGIHSGEYVIQRDDGTRLWVELTGAPIRDAQGAIIGAVAAIADVDASKRAGEALIRSEKLAVVGRLAATISHEINNPLEAVTNLLYLIQINTQDETAKAYSRTAQEELSRVSHIVTHTLRFNRQTYGALHERVSEILDSAAAIYDVRLRYSDIEVIRDYAETTRVFCLGSELRQVFANLIANSFDAMKHGGRLVLRTRNQTNWRTGEAGVRVTIADTGHGMDEKTRKRLFEPFFTTKGDNGTGLGLWVSREILNKHRATLVVKSRQGPGPGGTAFSMWLPAVMVTERSGAR